MSKEPLIDTHLSRSSRFILSVVIISIMMVLDYLLGYLGGASELCNIYDLSGQLTLMLLTAFALIMALSVGQMITGTKAGKSVRNCVILAGFLFCAFYYAYGAYVCQTGRQDQIAAQSVVDE